MTIETKVHFTTERAGQKRLRNGAGPVVADAPSPERIPRVSRLMALAIHFNGLIQRGVVQDYADLARLGGVTRARVTQIMNLLNLAPEIQEKLFFLPGTVSGRDTVSEREMRILVSKTAWAEQEHLGKIRIWPSVH